MAHLRYLSYVLRHKWFVALECWKRGLWWRGAAHDWHKFLPGEWFPYVDHFYGPKPAPGLEPETQGYFHEAGRDLAFDLAWLRHQKRGDHHWQWWLLTQDEDAFKVLPMSPGARSEMLCDWIGAGRAQGYGNNTHVWYAKNQGRMQLHPDTRAWIEQQNEVRSIA